MGAASSIRIFLKSGLYASSGSWPVSGSRFFRKAARASRSPAHQFDVGGRRITMRSLLDKQLEVYRRQVANGTLAKSTLDLRATRRPSTAN